MSNKDEALRAKDVAEDWMRKADFTTARRVAIRAQKMDASLESIVARMLMVCDVHCAALEKSGDETDWYKILQVDQNADDNTIKKQYRKLALNLHPHLLLRIASSSSSTVNLQNFAPNRYHEDEISNLVFGSWFTKVDLG